MAFDRPLEADRVDNNNLLSSFMRGPIMWALGGLLSEDKENAVNKQKLEDADPDGINTDNSTDRDTGRQSSVMDQKLCLEDLQLNIPSGGAIRRRSSEGRMLYTRNRSDASLSFDEKETSNPIFFQKKTRKMSWSDESGRNLVHYYDESNKSMSSDNLEDAENSTRSNPRMQTSPSRKPIKSAIRTGVRKPSQCIPSMIPTMPLNGKGCAPGCTKSGYISPQWGWYISTTPPTPEYSSSAKNQVLSHQMNTNNLYATNRPAIHGNFSKQPWNPSTTPIQESPQPIPVFSKGAPNYSSGWPTVPL